MANLSTNLPWMQAQPRWAAQLNPIVANPVNNVLILPNVPLVSGTNVINHLLGKNQQGWFITDINGAATIYRSQPFNSTTLTLVSNAKVVVNIGVF